MFLSPQSRARTSRSGLAYGSFILFIAILAVISYSLFAPSNTNPASDKPRAIVQAATVNVSSDGASPSAISLTWTESTDVFFTSYTLQYSTAGSNGPWSTLATITSKTQTSDYVYGLTPGSTYWWQIIDKDILGSQASNAFQEAQPSAATLVFSLTTSTSVTFTWNNLATYGGLLSFSSYQLFESVNGGVYNTAATVNSASTTTYTINGLSSSTGYSFYLSSTDECNACSGGSFPSSSVSNTVPFSTPSPLSAVIHATPDSVDVGQLVSFSCATAGGFPPYTYSWTFGDGSTGAGQNLSHSYTVSGTMDVACKVTDNLGSTANGPIIVAVSSDPILALPTAQPAVLDVGQSVILATSASGGSGGYSFSWSGLPTGCSSSNTGSLMCSPVASGSFYVSVSVTDSNGFTALSGPLSLTVNSSPTILAFSASQASFDVGQSVTFLVSASGGTAPLIYSYSGLPLGCSSVSATSVQCTPSATGSFKITVIAKDQVGKTATSSVDITVAGLPTIVLVTPSATSINVGENVVFTVTTQGGSAPLSYSYSGLPSGCVTANDARLSCNPSVTGTFRVGVTVTDAAGESATAYTDITVAPTFLGFPRAEGFALVGGISVAGLIAGIGALLISRARRPKKASP